MRRSSATNAFESSSRSAGSVTHSSNRAINSGRVTGARSRNLAVATAWPERRSRFNGDPGRQRSTAGSSGSAGGRPNQLGSVDGWRRCPAPPLPGEQIEHGCHAPLCKMDTRTFDHMVLASLLEKVSPGRCPASGNLKTSCRTPHGAHRAGLVQDKRDRWADQALPCFLSSTRPEADPTITASTFTHGGFDERCRNSQQGRIDVRFESGHC